MVNRTVLSHVFFLSIFTLKFAMVSRYKNMRKSEVILSCLYLKVRSIIKKKWLLTEKQKEGISLTKTLENTTTQTREKTVFNLLNRTKIQFFRTRKFYWRDKMLKTTVILITFFTVNRKSFILARKRGTKNLSKQGEQFLEHYVNSWDGISEHKV